MCITHHNIIWIFNSQNNYSYTVFICIIMNKIISKVDIVVIQNYLPDIWYKLVADVKPLQAIVLVNG